jgi:hypothetical protein
MLFVFDIDVFNEKDGFALTSHQATATDCFSARGSKH